MENKRGFLIAANFPIANRPIDWSVLYIYKGICFISY